MLQRNMAATAAPTRPAVPNRIARADAPFLLELELLPDGVAAEPVAELAEVACVDPAADEDAGVVPEDAEGMMDETVADAVPAEPDADELRQAAEAINTL